MPPPKKKSTINTNAVSEWYQKPITKISGAIVIIATLIGTGFKVGDFYRDLHGQTELNDQRFQYEKELREQVNACNERMQAYENKRVDDLENVMKELQKKQTRDGK